MKLPVENLTFPSDWTVSTISDVAEFSRGVSWGKAEETSEEKGLLVISIPNIKDGWIDYKSKFNHYLSKEVPESKRLNVGDIVFVGSSGSILNVGRNARVSSLPNGSVAFASFTFKATPKQPLINGEFFYFLVNSELVPFSSFSKRAADGKFNFQLRDFATRLRVPVPPLPEQKKIAQILSTVQRAIEAQERIIQTTTELKKALMHKLFTEGLRSEPQKQTEIGLIPKSWEVKRFDSFSVLQRGFDITKKDQRAGEIPVVSSGGISSYHDEAKVKGPGVVIGRKGSLGTVHYIASDYWPHDTTLWIKDFKGNNPRFAAYLIEMMKLKRFDTGAANPTLNRNIVHGERIAIPPTEQQVEIGKALETVGSKISIHQRRKLSFQDIFRTLLHELMTAKTRVGDIELQEVA